MTDTTYDEARRCPRCDELGQIVKTSQRDRAGNTLNTVLCANARCRWYNTTYLIEVRADGTVVQPHARVKSFPKLPDRSDEAIERSNQAMYQQTIAGGEIRN